MLPPSIASVLERLPTLSGHLKKLSSRPILGFHRWQTRYFVTDGPFLQYYPNSNKKSKVLASIDLRQCRKIRIRTEGNKGEFIVGVKQRDINLKAVDFIVAQKWVTHLKHRQNILWGIGDDEYNIADNSGILHSLVFPLNFRAINVPLSNTHSSLLSSSSSSSSSSFSTSVSSSHSNYPELGSPSQILHPVSLSFTPQEEKKKEETPRERMLRGEYGPVDAIEEIALEGMRNTFPSKEIEDGTLLRFLRARSFVVDHAAEMLRANLRWRNEFLPIDPESVREELSKQKYKLVGKDKLGHPLIVVTQRFLGPHTYSDFRNCLMALIFAFEKLCSVKLDPAQKFTVIFNREGASLKNVDLEWAKAVGRLLQDNYPERLYVGLVSPTSIGFRSVWNVAKVFFDKRTVEKIHLLPSNKDLLEFVDSEALLEELGGTNKIPFVVDDLLYPERDPANCSPHFLRTHPPTLLSPPASNTRKAGETPRVQRRVEKKRNESKKRKYS
jgi:hypothetical protein